MGVKGLLKLLSDASEQIDLVSLSGRTVAVDMYCWLHKGVLACSRDLALGKDVALHVKYCVKFIRSLVAHNITPIMVFDGAPHPMKANEDKRREDSRRKSLNTALTMEKQGSPSAHRHFASAVDVKPEDACMVVARVRADPELKHVQAITAPYEADAQLSYLVRTNVAYCAISEDSDLLVFGCPRVLFGLGNDGKGRMYELERVGSVEVDGVSLSSAPFTLPQLAALAGCDYVYSLPGIALTRACRVLRVRGGAADACRWLCARVSSEEVDRVCASVGVLDARGVVGGDELTRRAARYAAAVSRVCMVFRHQTVWDMRTRKLDHLTPLPSASALLALAWGAGLRADTEADAEAAVRAVVGPWWEDEDARRRCMCEANPITGVMFPPHLRTYTAVALEQRRPQPASLGSAARPPRPLSSLRRRTSDVIVTATSSSSSTAPTSSATVVSLSAAARAKVRLHNTDSAAHESPQTMVREQRRAQSPRSAPELPTLPPPTLTGASTPQSTDSVPSDHARGVIDGGDCPADDGEERRGGCDYGRVSESEERVVPAPSMPLELQPKVDVTVQLQRANAFIARMRGHSGQSTHDVDKHTTGEVRTRMKREREDDEECVPGQYHRRHKCARQHDCDEGASCYRNHDDMEDKLDVERGDSRRLHSTPTGHNGAVEPHPRPHCAADADDVPAWIRSGDGATSYTRMSVHEGALSRHSRAHAVLQTSVPRERFTSPALKTRTPRDDRTPSHATMGLRLSHSHTRSRVESTPQDKHSSPLRRLLSPHHRTGASPATQPFTPASTTNLSIGPVSRTRATATSSAWLDSLRMDAGSPASSDVQDSARSCHIPPHTSREDVRYTTPRHAHTHAASARSHAPIGTPYDDHDPADTPSWLRSHTTSASRGSHGASARGAGKGENDVMSDTVSVPRSTGTSSTSWLSDGYCEERPGRAAPYSTAANVSVPHARARAVRGMPGVSWLEDQENVATAMGSAPSCTHTRTPAKVPLGVSSAQHSADLSAGLSDAHTRAPYSHVRNAAVRADDWRGFPKISTPRGERAQQLYVDGRYHEHKESDVLVFACGGDASQDGRNRYVSPVRTHVTRSASSRGRHYSPATVRVDALPQRRNDGGVVRTGRSSDGLRTAFPGGLNGQEGERR